MDGNPASSSSSESAQIINRDYSFHRAVFNNDITVLKSLLETNEKAGIDDLDTNGRTALMLAVMLNHEDCAELLLKNGADANTQNSGNWGLSHEAILINNRHLLEEVLTYRDYQRASKMLEVLKDLAKNLVEIPDYYVEINWLFSSWIPRISSYFPSDTYKIYKKGHSIRIDLSIPDYKNPRGARVEQSIVIVLHPDNTINIYIIDFKNSQCFTHTVDLNEVPSLDDFRPSDDVLDQKLHSPITTTYLNIDNVGIEKERSYLSKVLSWIGSDEKDEEVEGFACRQYVASNVEIISKIIYDHLSEDDLNMHSSNSNPTLELVKDILCTKKVIGETNTDEKKFNDLRRGQDLVSYLSVPSDPNTSNIGRIRKETVRSKSFNANLWISDSFPLNFRDQIFPILNLLSVRDEKFNQLKSFINLQLPSGFPVKIKIPMFQLMGAQITFKNVNNPGQQSGSLLPGDFVLDDSLFSIPDDFVVNPANASSLFSHFGLFESDDFNSTNESIYLDESVLSNANSPRSSSYRDEIQIAIDESLTTYANRVDSSSSQNNDEDELTKALELSLQDDGRRRQEELDEEEELTRILKLSMIEQ